MDVEAPVDKHGFTQKPLMTDQEVILKCLENAPCGICPKQVLKIIKEIKS